jgi:plasmid stabilization system protein ParE
MPPGVDPAQAAIWQLSDMAQRGTNPSRMRDEVRRIVGNWRFSDWAEEEDALRRQVDKLHGHLASGVAAAQELIEGLDREDARAIEHSAASLAVLVAARDTAEMEKLAL